MDSKNPSGAKSRAEVYDWIQCIIFALVFCVLLFVFAVRMVNVVGHSMVPTLEQSDKVVISNLFYHPKQGDVVVLRKQTLMEEPIVKRIIATEGQTVDIDFDDGVVYVDGKALDEPYVNEPCTTGKISRARSRCRKLRVRHGRQPQRLHRQPRRASRLRR